MNTFDKNLDYSSNRLPHSEIHLPPTERANAYSYPEHLPLTQIDQDARLMLEQWGVPENFVLGLQALTSYFRYDLCLPRTEELVSRGGIYYERTGEPAQVILPKFDNDVDTPFGQCGSLTVKFIRSLHTTGWLADVNAFLTDHGKKPLSTVYTSGYSNTFFTHGMANHVWAGLQPNGLYHDDNNMALIDPSFQTITRFHSSGYNRTNDYVLNPRSFERYPYRMVRIGSYDPSFNNLQSESTVLGVSHDRKHTLSIGFARNDSLPLDTNDSGILPFIGIGHPNGGWSTVINYEGSVEWKLQFDVSSGTQVEAEDMLQALQSFDIQQDDTFAYMTLTGRVPVIF